MATDDRSFWRNVTIIGVAHVALIGGVARWSDEAKKAVTPDIMWMDSGAAAALVSSVATAAAKPPEMRPEIAEQPTASPAEEYQLMRTAGTSDLQVPTPTPTPIPTPIPTPTPAEPTPTPSPKPKSSPSPTPRASPKPTPKATPKPSPTPSPKKTLIAKAEPTPKKKVVAEEPVESPKIDAATPAPADAPTETASTGAASASAGRQGSQATGSGPATASQVSSYRRLLHDRFYKEWVQPTSVVPAGTKISALVKIRIEKDGRVTGFNIVQPSGNVLVDASVAAVGRRVTHVDPLPAGISQPSYEVNMNFELTLTQ